MITPYPDKYSHSVAIKAVSATPLLPGVKGIIMIIHITKDLASTIKWSRLPEIARIIKFASTYLASHANEVAMNDLSQKLKGSFFNCLDVRLMSIPVCIAFFRHLFKKPIEKN